MDCFGFNERRRKPDGVENERGTLCVWHTGLGLMKFVCQFLALWKGSGFLACLCLAFHCGCECNC